jgi:hypothetical protein
VHFISYTSSHSNPTFSIQNNLSYTLSTSNSTLHIFHNIFETLSSSNPKRYILHRIPYRLHPLSTQHFISYIYTTSPALIPYTSYDTLNTLNYISYTLVPTIHNIHFIQCTGNGIVVPSSSHKQEVAGLIPGWVHKNVYLPSSAVTSPTDVIV